MNLGGQIPLVTADVNHQDRQEEKNGMLFYVSTLHSSCFLSHFWLWCANKDQFWAHRHLIPEDSAPVTQLPAALQGQDSYLIHLLRTVIGTEQAFDA